MVAENAVPGGAMMVTEISRCASQPSSSSIDRMRDHKGGPLIRANKECAPTAALSWFTRFAQGGLGRDDVSVVS